MAVIATVEVNQLLDYRFDAECYRPEFQELERRIAALNSRPLQSVAFVSDGNHVSIANYFCDSGIRYLKGAEVSDVFINDADPTFIPRKIYSEITRAQVSPGDVLLSVIGSIGPAALVTDKYECLSCSCKLAILRPHSISGALLIAYLLSSTGQTLLKRRTRGSVQQGVVLPDVRSFPVPQFTNGLRGRVAKLIADASREMERANSLYPEAEAELLDRMGWNEIKREPTKLTYVKALDELDLAGRIDAEFFHPQYAQLRSKLRDHGMSFRDLVFRFRKGLQPEYYDADGEVLVLKSKQVTARGVRFDLCERTIDSVWNDKDSKLGEGDLVINSTGRGTLGRAAVIPPFCGKAVASVDLVIAQTNPHLIDAEYAALFLNSPAGLAQSEQFQTGSSGQLHLYPQHFEQFVIYVPRQKNGTVDHVRH